VCQDGRFQERSLRVHLPRHDLRRRHLRRLCRCQVGKNYATTLSEMALIVALSVNNTAFILLCHVFITTLIATMLIAMATENYSPSNKYLKTIIQPSWHSMMLSKFTPFIGSTSFSLKLFFRQAIQ